MKKIFALLIALLLLAGGVAAAETVEEVVPVQTEGIVIPVIDNLKKFDIPDNEAMDFVRELKAGWNLGNTFDAYDDSPDGYAKGLKMESTWTRALTSRKLMHALKNAGFNLIRIPVSWHNHVDENNTIDPDWLARVREVAGWAVDEGMYIIINVHHDNHVQKGRTNYFYPDEAHYEQSAAYLGAIWSQVADAFADFDEHCILESMNEPRLVGTDYEWWFDGSAESCREAANCINRLNQLFVDTVRAKGGNNATRYLAVPAYCASPSSTINSAFHLPTDSAENRIILSAHAYTPYDFALNLQSGDCTFDLEKDQNKKAQIAQFMNDLYNCFVSKGIPVILDEFGVLKKKDSTIQARVNFAAYYIASASTRGITCCWWDNHAFIGSGELFGLIDRNTIQWKYPDIVLAIMSNCRYNRE